MSEPFLAEIRMVGFNFAPRGWALCDGQILPINQNQSLYSLLGTTYGGDGRTSYGLPDMRGRTPIHATRTGHIEGQKVGTDTHALTEAEMPKHSHIAQVANVAADNTEPTGRVLAESAGLYAPADGSTITMAASNLANSGGGHGHNNMQPSLALNFCIALQGLFPSRN